VTSSLTQPAGPELPLVEEEELPSAVVDGGLALHLGDLRQLDHALRTLRPDAQQEVPEEDRGPGAHVTLRPV